MKRHIGLLLLYMLLAATASADTDLTGEIGVDLVSLSYQTELNDTAWNYSAGRSSSNHFINLNLAGPVVNDHFANYAASLRLLGSYIRSSTSTETTTDYIQPGIRGFYGQATFLPDKPFPFRLYRSEVNEFPLQYEPNNRSDRERLQPALSIIRRYRQDRDASGAVWQLSPSERVRFLTEYKQENYAVSRIYDFGEDSDIWVSFIKSPAMPGDTVFTVFVDNKLPDTANIEIVNLDSITVNPGFPPLMIEDLPPDHTRTIYLFPGRTEIQIASPGLNQYFNIIEVDSNMVVSISYEDPASPNDIDQRNKSISNQLKLGNSDSRAKNETHYEYSDQREIVKNKMSYNHSLTNTLNYTLSERVNADMLFSLQDSRTLIDTTSKQWNRVLMNQTSLGYFERQGISVSASHTWSRNYSFSGNVSAPVDTAGKNNNDTLTSTVNNFIGRLTYPSRKYNHRFDLRGNVNLLSDNQGYVNNQYTVDVTNSMEWFARGIEWQPRHLLRYAHNLQENPSKKSQEIETKLTLTGTNSTALLGDIKLKGEYSYRNRWDEIGTDLKTRYLVDASLIRKLGETLRISLMANQEWEVTGGTAPGITGSSSGNNIRYKSSYKFDVNAAPHKDLNMTGTVMLISQGDNSINKFGFSLNVIIPMIRVPWKTVILAESRSLKGQDPQDQLNLETSISHRIRKVSLTVKYIYQREQLSFETYSVSEIRGKISRQFGVF